MDVQITQLFFKCLCI